MKTLAQGRVLSIRIMPFILQSGAEKRGEDAMRNSHFIGPQMTVACTVQWEPSVRTGLLHKPPRVLGGRARTKPVSEEQYLDHRCRLVMLSLCSVRSGESHSLRSPWSQTHKHEGNIHSAQNYSVATLILWVIDFHNSQSKEKVGK